MPLEIREPGSPIIQMAIMALLSCVHGLKSTKNGIRSDCNG